MPLHHPAVQRYVAVDEVCVDRLVREEGISRERVELVLNFVDLERFRPRAPLPDRPHRALVLSNAATTTGYAGAIITACRAADIEVDVVGMAAGNATAAPEVLLRGYDLVFAKGRTALEALAVGCAVVLADAAGAGPLVTPDNYPMLRVRNFGIRELRQSHDVAWFGSQIAKYGAVAAADVSVRVRAEAGLEHAVDRLLGIYSAAMAAPSHQGEPSRAAAIHCCRIARRLKQAFASEQQALASEQRARTLTTELEAARARSDELLQAARASDLDLASAREELELLRSRVAAFQSLPTLRLRDALLRAPVVGSLLQASARRLAKRLL
jgi:hypothetical protein